MGKFILIHGVMGAGKTSKLVQDIYNYEQMKNRVLLGKPHADKKGGDFLDSRMIGKFYRPVDVLIKPDETFAQACLREKKSYYDYDYIAIDEGQFLFQDQVFELWVIAKEDDKDIIVSSLTTNFLGELFEGSKALLALADEKIEVYRNCQIPGCRDIAKHNSRKINGVWQTSGEEILIDGEKNVEYVSLCGQHFYEHVKKESGRQFVLR